MDNDQIRYIINHTPYPQKSALIKGLEYELTVRNPYHRRSNWSRSFFNQFNIGRQLKIKYNYKNTLL